MISVLLLPLFSGMALELGVPWLVRYGPPWTVHLFLLSGILLVGGLFAAVAMPLYEMWWTRETIGTIARPQAWQPGEWPSSLRNRSRSRQ